MQVTRARGQRGAAAVEFGLIAPLLFLILFGIIQYGLYFYDALGTRQGVREAARQGVVKTFPTCGSAATDWDKLKCNTKSQLEVIAGTAYVKVSAPNGWARGKPLLVCAIVKSNDPIGFLPMPNNGFITTKTQLSIEKDTAPTGTASADTPPTGANWSWCA